MKRWIGTALVVALIGFAGVTARGEPTGAFVQAVKDREAQRHRAMIEVDVPVLTDLFAEDATYVHSNGLFQTKAGVIAMLEKKELRYVSFRVEEAAYRAYGETVVCTGKQSIQLTSSGRPFTSNSRYTVVYASVDGKARLVAYQSTLLPEIVKQEATEGE